MHRKNNVYTRKETNIMGMYDTINSEQVKCFQHVTYNYDRHNNTHMWSHGGSLKNFNDNDAVPYRSLCYNYHENFNILDLHPTALPFDNGIVLHAIRDGKVKESITIELNDTNLIPKELQERISGYLSTTHTIGYTGYPNLNVHSYYDMLALYNESNARLKKLADIRTESHRRMNAWAKAVRKLHNQDLSDTQRNQIQNDINQLKTAYDDERKRIEPEIDNLNMTFIKKWYVPTSSELNKYISFGEWITAGLNLISEHHPLNADEHPINTDEQLEKFFDDFQRRFQGTVNEKFVQQYFTWCEATPAEQIAVNSLIAKMIEH